MAAIVMRLDQDEIKALYKAVITERDRYTTDPYALRSAIAELQVALEDAYTVYSSEGPLP